MAGRVVAAALVGAAGAVRTGRRGIRRGVVHECHVAEVDRGQRARHDVEELGAARGRVLDSSSADREGSGEVLDGDSRRRRASRAGAERHEGEGASGTRAARSGDIHRLSARGDIPEAGIDAGGPGRHGDGKSRCGGHVDAGDRHAGRERECAGKGRRVGGRS